MPPRQEPNAAVTFEPEFSLAIECCRWNFTGGTGAVADHIERVNWGRFAQIARFHRIEGLASAALADAGIAEPRIYLNSLADHARVIAAENLRVTAASRELLRAFEAARTPLLFVKGLTLGCLAYSNATVKSAIDIDFLVDRNDLSRAADLLRKCGFELLAPRPTPGDRTLGQWHRQWKESVWASRSPPLQVDLHTRLADNSRLIPSICVHSPRQLVEVGNELRLPTLATEELFAYLAVHGASSAWFRLKWISDFAGFVHRCGAANLRPLYRRSQELGAGRAAGQALLLADRLFGSLRHDPGLRDKLLGDRVTARLFRTALELLAGEPVEPTERPWGTLPIHRSQFSLLPGLAYRLSELSGQLQRRISRVR